MSPAAAACAGTQVRIVGAVDAVCAGGTGDGGIPVTVGAESERCNQAQGRGSGAVEAYVGAALKG